LAAAASREGSDGPARSAGAKIRILWLAVSAAALAAIAALGLDYPLDAAWLFVGLAIYGLILWVRPGFWLVAVPALLPTLDLMRWTGWLYLGESDFIMLATIAVRRRSGF
jgi:hypothetical protein